MVKKGNARSIPLKADTEAETARIADELQRASAAKDSAKTTEEKLAASKRFEEAKTRQKEVISTLYL